jgi:fatty-acyl-CoA synthase
MPMKDPISPSSQMRGAFGAPLIEQSIGRCFDGANDRYGDHDAVVERKRSVRWSYGSLRERVDAAALGLLGFGLKPGDRIGVWSPNCAEWPVVQFAAAKAGLVLVGINPALRAEELAYTISKVECAALVYAAALKPILAELRPDAGAAGRVPTLRLVVELGGSGAPDVVTFEEVLTAGAGQDKLRLAEIGERIRPADAAMIQFTSGTTGPPKAATLSHRNVVNSAFFGGERLGITSEDRICVPVPLFHAFGSIGGNLMAAMRGAAVIYPSPGFDPGQVLAAIQDERCTAVYGVPAMFAAELNHPRFATFDVSSLRTGIIAGSPCPEALMRRVMEDMHLPELVTAFGMTETSAAGLATSRDDPVERRLRSVGRVTAHTELKIVDEMGAVVPRGVAGELCTRGFSVMQGYWGDPEATAQVVDADGWMRTGDLVAIDEEGWGTVLGRVRDVVNVAGEKVLPGEVEALLLRHPAIEAAQVFGIPDEARGEVVCAWIKLKPGQELTTSEIRDFCSRHVSVHKTPRHVDFVGAFPTTTTGKVQKYVLREQMLANSPPRYAQLE